MLILTVRGNIHCSRMDGSGFGGGMVGTGGWGWGGRGMESFCSIHAVYRWFDCAAARAKGLEEANGTSVCALSPPLLPPWKSLSAHSSNTECTIRIYSTRNLGLDTVGTDSKKVQKRSFFSPFLFSPCFFGGGFHALVRLCIKWIIKPLYSCPSH